MDMGVGSFLLSNALVYRQTRRKSVVNLLLRMTPLLVLGFVRLLTVKGTDYQVSTYRPHCVSRVSCLSTLWPGVTHPPPDRTVV
jgi:uncharacterized membrane protein